MNISDQRAKSFSKNGIILCSLVLIIFFIFNFGFAFLLLFIDGFLIILFLFYKYALPYIDDKANEIILLEKKSLDYHCRFCNSLVIIDDVYCPNCGVLL